MLIFQSILVYGFIIWVMTCFGNIAYKTQYPQGWGRVDMFSKSNISYATMLTKIFFLIPILVFCFFAAVRFRVGTDCESYKVIFYDIVGYGESLIALDIEKGFKGLVTVTNWFANSHYLLLFILAFLQISFLYYAFRKDTHILKFLGLTIFLSGSYFSLMNGIRQNVVACAFVLLLPFVFEKKKWIWYITCVYIATFMHRSAYVLCPLGFSAYFLQHKIPNKSHQLCLVAICFLLMDKIDIANITSLFSTYGAEAGYNENAIEVYTNMEAMTKAFGFRSLLLLASYLICIFYSERMNIFFNSKIFNIQYNLFFIGVCLFLLFYNNYVIARFLYYLRIFIPIIFSTTLFYLMNSKSKDNKIVFWIMITLLVLHLAYELYVATQDFPNEFVLYKFDIFN